MLDKLSREVSCSFARHTRMSGAELEQHDVIVPTGMAAWRLKLRQAALDRAVQEEWHLWAMPGLCADNEDWLVYRFPHNGVGPPTFEKRMPTRDAAEMWMLHDSE